MDSALEDLLRRWLESGTEQQKRHAKARLEIGDSPPPVPPSYPPLVKQAANFGKAMVGFARDGLRVVDATERSRRLEICHACDRYDPMRGRCRACGCMTDLKARIASQHCPINKW